MKIRGSLRDGTQIALQFYGQEDIRPQEFSDEPKPTSWAQLSFPEADARNLLQWLRNDRSVEFQDGSVVARGSSDWLMIEDTLSGIAMRLGTDEEISTLTRELSGALALISGHGVDPTE